MSNGNIPFRKQMEFEYGVADEVTPMVRRIVARNPSGFTYHGTNTYIIGRGRVAVIDPGPVLEEHLEAIATELRDETVEHILVTHTHHDHSPAASPLRDRVGGFIWGARARPIPKGEKTSESIQWDFDPDEELADGVVIESDDWSLESVYTPGHMSNHMCFALPQENILFSGDHIMSWNTTVVSPPDGNMREYFESLEVCLHRGETSFWPAHGPEILDPKPFTRAYREHRHKREREILECLERGLHTIAEIVDQLYKHIPITMHKAAARSVLAHLEHMVETGRATCDGSTNEFGKYAAM